MDKKLILDFDKKQKSLKNKRAKERGSSSSSSSGQHHHGRSKQIKLEQPEAIEPSVSYRDRARERREGINRDFELDPDDLRIANPTIGGSLQQLDDCDEQQTIDETERRRQQIEESKYLGGDVEHTHLVKGLDFALLEKVKNDQKLAERLANDRDAERDTIFAGEDSDSDEEQFTKEALLAASATASSKRQLVDIEKLRKGKSTEIIPCRTALARRILNVLDEKRPAKSELFLPGRMSYVIPIEEESEETVTTILTSKADASKQDENDALNESDLALNQLINILARIRQGQKGGGTTSKRMRDLERDRDLSTYHY